MRTRLEIFWLAALVAGLTSGCATRALDPKPWRPPAYFAPVSYAEVGGMKLAYLETGPDHAPAVVFVHGFSGDLQNWWDQYDHFKDRYHVVILDDPGHGKSEREEYFEYDMSIAGQAVIGLMDELGIEKAALVGNSMGGHIVAWTAINYPQRVTRLVLSDAAGSSDMSDLAWIKPLVTPAVVKFVLTAPGKQYKGDDPKQVARQAHIDSFKGTVEEPLYYQALAQCIKSLALDPILDDLDRISAPTLLIWGDNDPLVKPKTMDVFADHIPMTSRYLVHQGGHTPHMDQPAEFNCAVDLFLQGLDLDVCQGLGQ